MVLGAYLHAVLSVEEQQGGVCHIECRNIGTGKVVSSGAIDDVQLLAVPLSVEDGAEHTVSIFLLYGEVVRNGVLLRDAAATFDDTCLVEQ